MNQQQLKYARERADAILKRRLEKVTERHTTPAVVLSKAAIRDALLMEEYTLKAPEGDKPNHYSWLLRDFFSFSGESPRREDAAAIKADTKALKTEHGQLVDALVLGDSAEALALLKAFEGADV